ncbi:alpha/beta hydrolase [Xanthomonas campestris]|uniref:alpha/beta hydrolase n=1 Tax=Xanthomonas cannabis TaxID=1885674 RepID=UPI001E618DCA|nr:alpha/beta hydrolase [Xanthomonas campestris pv. zinniae]
MTDNGKPNPIIDTLANIIGTLRADDDMHQVALAHDALEPKAIEKLTPQEARQQPTIADAVNKVLQDQGKTTDPEVLVPGVKRTAHTLETPAGNLPALIYTPNGGTQLPVIVYFHGGGWVIANAQVYDGGARGLAKGTGAIVVSVDYRQAPEHKFPAAWDDALAAYEWVLANAASIGGNPRLVALAGESAGGNLAIATAVAARDKGLQAPTHILAVYPVGQTGSLHTESYIENAIAKPLNKAMIEWFVGHLIRSDADKQDTRLDLVNANLRGLAPVTLINATIDPLRSDGAKLEDAFKEANVPVEREVYTGVTHEFFGCAAVVAKAKAAQEYAGKRLRESFR